MEVAILFAAVIGLLILGVPIAVALGLASIGFLLVFSDASLASISQTLFNAFEGHATLLAIPFFILASAFLSTGGVARRIIRFAIAVVGHLPGGLAMASVVACMIFAALSGSSPATVVAIGSIVIAGMLQVGYTKEFAAGVICNAGTLGILIPPSIVMVVYATATEVSVGRMFLAGIIPGLMAGVMLMIGIYIAAKVKKLPSQDWAGWREVFESLLEAVWGLLLIGIILGGIYGGVFTPTEAAAVAAVYALFVALFVYRDMGALKEKGWLRAHERARGVLGFRIWVFAAVTILLYAAIAWAYALDMTIMLIAAAGVSALYFVAGALLLRAEEKGQADQVSVTLVAIMGGGALVVFTVLGWSWIAATLANNMLLGAAAYLLIVIAAVFPPAMLLFSLRGAAAAREEGGIQSFGGSLAIGLKGFGRGLGETLLYLAPNMMHAETRKTFYEAGKLTVMLMFVIANALILKHVLTEERIPQQIAESMLEAGLGPVMFLVVVNVLLLLGGQFMEPSGLLIIVAPLVFPIAIQLGIDPIHLGVMMVVNMEIGMITPPVGLNLFVTAGVARMSVSNVVVAALPWVGILFIFLIMITYIPWISTVVPNAVMGPEIVN